MIDRVNSDKIEKIQSDHMQAKILADSALRTERAELVRSIAMELETAKPIGARWAWLEDMPKSVLHDQAERLLAQEIQSAQDRYIQRLGEIQITRQDAISQTRYELGRNIRRIQFDALEFENLWMEREGNLQSEFEAMYGLRQAESRTKYQRRMIEDQARELEEIYRKLDPQSRSLLKQQNSLGRPIKEPSKRSRIIVIDKSAIKSTIFRSNSRTKPPKSIERLGSSKLAIMRNG
jgi:hypothetical protein